MTEDIHDPIEPMDADSAMPVQSPEPWKTVYMGQISGELVPYHPEPPEAPEDELTQAAMADPRDVNLNRAHETSAPTFWRVLVVVMLAVGALAVVFWKG